MKSKLEPLSDLEIEEWLRVADDDMRPNAMLVRRVIDTLIYERAYHKWCDWNGYPFEASKRSLDSFIKDEIAHLKGKRGKDDTKRKTRKP